MGRLSCAGGRCTSVLFNLVPEESEVNCTAPNTDPARAYFYPIQRPHPGLSTCLCSRSARYVACCPDVLLRSSWRQKTKGSTPTRCTRCDRPLPHHLLHHRTIHLRSATCLTRRPGARAFSPRGDFGYCFEYFPSEIQEGRRRNEPVDLRIECGMARKSLGLFGERNDGCDPRLLFVPNEP